MELDELKAAWALLGARLDAEVALNRQRFADSRLDKARAALNGVRRGQWLQVIAGVAIALLSQSFWWEHRASAHLLTAGLVGHAYGLAMIVLSVRTIWMVARVDYSEPVITIQQRMGELERFYLGADLALALAWWVLWIPLALAAGVALLGIDFYLLSPAGFWINVSAGLVGLVASVVVFLLSRRPGYPRLAAFVERNLLHRRLLEARAFVADVERFGQEG